MEKGLPLIAPVPKPNELAVVVVVPNPLGFPKRFCELLVCAPIPKVDPKPVDGCWKTGLSPRLKPIAAQLTELNGADTNPGGCGPAKNTIKPNPLRGHPLTLPIRLVILPSKLLQRLPLVLLHAGDAVVLGVDRGGHPALLHGVRAGQRLKLDDGSGLRCGPKAARATE